MQEARSKTLRNDDDGEDIDNDDDDQLLSFHIQQPTPKAKEQSGVMEA